MNAPTVLHLERSWAAPAADPQANPQTEQELRDLIWSGICEELCPPDRSGLELLRGWRLIYLGDGIGELSMPVAQLVELLLQGPATYLLCTIEDRLQRAAGDVDLSLLLSPIQEPSTAGEED